MRRVLLFSILLVLGLVGSQVLPALGGKAYASLAPALQWLTMIGLSFIMIHVGYEFEIDKSKLGQYGWDYVVAMTAAAFPWLFAAGYFLWVMTPTGDTTMQAVTESLLVGRFAAPTSAGILFAMLAAAGLSATWVFQKARVLAIFDDLDTVLLMMPLKMLVIGWAWSLGVAVGVMVVLFWLAWQYLHRLRWPVSWPWVIGYAFGVTALAEAVHLGTMLFFRDPVHIEVLLPAFVLGCMLARPGGTDPHSDDAREGHQEGLESPGEQRVAMLVSSAFMVLVGLSMPPLFNAEPAAQIAEWITEAEALALPNAVPHHVAAETAAAAAVDWGAISLHVIVLTVLINLGKMFPAFCYRREASLRERFALSIGLWPRGEVGAGVLLLSIGYGIGGDAITVAMLCLVLNLVLTGFFIAVVKGLLKKNGQSPRPNV